MELSGLNRSSARASSGKVTSPETAGLELGLALRPAPTLENPQLVSESVATSSNHCRRESPSVGMLLKLNGLSHPQNVARKQNSL